MKLYLDEALKLCQLFFLGGLPGKENQFYKAENVECRNGALIITAQRERAKAESKCEAVPTSFFSPKGGFPLKGKCSDHFPCEGMYLVSKKDAEKRHCIFSCQKNFLAPLSDIRMIQTWGTLVNSKSGWWFQIFFFQPSLGEMIQFDYIIFFKWVETTN